MGYTFDGEAQTITLTAGTTTFSARDLYSRWKDWVLAGTGAIWPEAFTAIGNDDLGGSIYAGDYYFLQDGWTILPLDLDHTLVVTGNLYPATAGAQMFGERAGRTIQIQLARSNLTQTVAMGSGVLPADVTAIATASRDAILSDATRFAGASIDAAVSSRAVAGEGLTAGQATQLSTTATRVDAAISTRATAAAQATQTTWIERLATVLGAPGAPASTLTSSGTIGAGGTLTTLRRVAGVLWGTVVTLNAGTADEDVTVTPEADS